MAISAFSQSRAAVRPEGTTQATSRPYVSCCDLSVPWHLPLLSCNADSRQQEIFPYDNSQPFCEDSDSAWPPSCRSGRRQLEPRHANRSSIPRAGCLYRPDNANACRSLCKRNSSTGPWRLLSAGLWQFLSAEACYGLGCLAHPRR